MPGLSVDACHALGGYFLSMQIGVQDGVNASLRAHVASALSAFLSGAQERGAVAPAQVVSHVRVDSPALGIVQLAAEVGADLIIVGSHGQQTVPRILMGSVAENTLRYAGCPVLVIPDEARGSRAPRVAHVSAP